VGRKFKLDSGKPLSPAPSRNAGGPSWGGFFLTLPADRPILPEIAGMSRRPLWGFD
jgi:hypothetical protein